MTKLSWGDVGQRFYEAGVDRGVLYLPNSPGVAWNGLRSVKESPSGGAPTPFYQDGIKYLNIAQKEEFEATIEAFSSPYEFGECDGTRSLSAGLFATQQPRKSFNLSYRTMVGNDLEGLDYGYKIHLVYNALASPSGKSNSSIGNSSDPTALAWDITTTPPRIFGYNPTAHFIIDSRSTPKYILDLIERQLYGSDVSVPTIPTAQDLVDLFKSYVTIEMFVEQLDGGLLLEKVPAIMSPVQPEVAAGEEILWVDTSAGTYSRIFNVTGD